MEFPEIGANCFIDKCNRLDFLPLKCNLCNSTFCQQHFHNSTHECTRKDNLDRKTVEITSNGKLACGFGNCKVKELLAVYCTQCKDMFCLKHRDVADHNCISLNSEKASSKSELTNLLTKVKQGGQVVTKTNVKPVRKGTRQTRILLLKRKAKGDLKLEYDKRVYLSIVLPNPTEEQFAQLTYFDKSLTLGKVIDKCKVLFKIDSSKIIGTEKRLMAFSLDGLSYDYNMTISKISLKEGSELLFPTIILDYVNLYETSPQIDLSNYNLELD